MKIRIKFKKHGVMRFVGHLDIMRYFQKAIRRAGIDIAYSTGFSPHQKMSFAAPLGVGLMSDGEYLDIEVNATLSSAESVKKLNEVMVEGMEVVSYKALGDDSKNAMSLVAAADYFIAPKTDFSFPLSYEDFVNGKQKFLVDRNEIMLTKKTKKSETQIDIKPLIYQFSANENEKTGQIDSIFLKTATGSVNNLKPEFVLEAFFAFLGLEYDSLQYQVTRKEVYADLGKNGKHKWVSLEELGTDVG